jgi:Ca-activated chloride channel family protein
VCAAWRRGTARSIVVVTDGFVSIETESFDLIRQPWLRECLRFGIGSSVNRFLIEGRASARRAFIVTNPRRLMRAPSNCASTSSHPS